MTDAIRVLHVDDEPGFAEMAAEFLEREDDRIRVSTATSASEGLNELRETDVDCVVSDYDMPDTNGIAFLESVREEYPELPFVLFTGKGSEEVASEAISTGATDYLQKEGGTDQYTILANRVSNCVDTAQAKTRRQRQLAALHEAATDLEAADSADDVYDILVDASERILDFDLVAVDILDGDALVQEAWSLDLNTEGYYQETNLEDDTFATRAYHRQETILVDDLATFDITPADPEYRSALTVPIADIGTFQTVSREEAAFDDVDRELAELLVGHGREALTRLETEQELRDRTGELRRQNERLEEFAAIVSHDLRTPLSVAEGRLELARAEGGREQFDAVADALDRMSTIIEETLTLARQGELVTEGERVDVPAVARRCWSRVEDDDGSFSVAEDGVVWGDPERLQRVFENLFRNAVEHAGEDVSVTVGATADGFYVADDGPGIPVGDREAVFERGYTTSESGTGFGLSIVTEIVDAHGGDVEVVESDDGGARFEVTELDCAE